MAKILLVEDDNNLREIYEARLQAEGYDIVSARDGEEALTVAMKERPDLIISDVMMPKISGFDMLDIIRSTEETKNAKVIMMTALSQAEDKERATKLGADRYLVKSQVTLEDVAKVAREVLAGDSGSDTTEPIESITDSTPAAVEQAPAPVVALPTVPAPVDEPSVTPTATPVPTPVVDEPATVMPTPDPVTPSEPATVVADPTVASSPAMTAISPAPVASIDEIVGVDAVEKSVEDEQSAIAAQIESFIEVKKNESEATTDTTPPSVTASEENTTPAIEPAKTESVAVEEKQTEDTAAPVVTDASEPTKKKIIQPISDPTASKGADLENLLKKEQEKEQMAEIAKAIATEKVDVAEELSAEAALRSAARVPVTPMEDTAPHVAPEVNITENGDLKVQAPPQEVVAEPEVTTPPVDTSDVPVVATEKPIIPHSNGTNLDGVVQPGAQVAPQQTQSPETPQTPPAGPDPNAIAL
jgi:CheY-like chemotaxis protein